MVPFGGGDMLMFGGKLLGGSPSDNLVANGVYEDEKSYPDYSLFSLVNVGEPA